MSKNTIHTRQSATPTAPISVPLVALVFMMRKLSEGGNIEQCGWLKDKYGVPWQIVPADIGKMLQSKDGEKADRVMRAHPANEKARH
jgi:3-demethylubiquinone-9 3-methyltransferase